MAARTSRSRMPLQLQTYTGGEPLDDVNLHIEVCDRCCNSFASGSGFRRPQDFYGCENRSGRLTRPEPYHWELLMPSLFDPVRIGDLTLKNRIVMAPLTRAR